jgi:hypothetical protein
MRWFVAPLTVAAFFSSAPAADDVARAVIEKAIKAQGGAAKVAKLRVMRIKVEGTMTLAAGQPAVSFVIEDWWQMPDRYKTTSRFDLGGKKVSQTQALDGETGWMQLDGVAQDLPKEAVAEMREQKYAEDLDRLGFLADRGVDVSSAGGAKVGGRDAVGVVVKSNGHRPVTLYFDKETGLLAKREHKVADGATGKDVTQEVVFGDYREADGLKHYHTLTAYRDGKKWVEAKVVELEFFDKPDKKVFAKP